MKDQTTPLWDVKHPYYCNEGNYYASSSQPRGIYKTWAEFVSEEGDSDMDYNLLFRWDWREGNDDGAADYNGDDYYRNGKLLLFWMGQRKGLYRWSEVVVCRADEPAVRAWLLPRFEYLLKLWAPLAIIQEQPQ